jgi:hypothetical protein
MLDWTALGRFPRADQNSSLRGGFLSTALRSVAEALVASRVAEFRHGGPDLWSQPGAVHKLSRQRTRIFMHRISMDPGIGTSIHSPSGRLTTTAEATDRSAEHESEVHQWGWVPMGLIKISFF